MISKDFLKQQLIRLQTNYGSDKFDLSKTAFDLWYEMFSDCDEDGLRVAVTNCIKESEFAPNIAGLMKYYRALEVEHEELKQSIRSNYTNLMSKWRESYSKETLQAIKEFVLRFPKEQRIMRMEELTYNAFKFYDDCVSCGRKQIPTIKEYVEGKRK
ncbi:MAG: hypothetical protein J6Y78_08575 [Paludibacteraceae bacterium]|nr:hypothetical protein [Paludibacteraceae bacterium]